MKKIISLLITIGLCLSCWSEPPKKIDKPEEKTVIRKPSITIPIPKVQPVTKQSKPYILRVVKYDGYYTVKLNKLAVNKMRAGALIKLHIGYCVYYGKILNNNTIKVDVDWSPPVGRISVGLFCNGAYITSVLISK